MLAPPFLGTRIQLQSDQRYMTTGERERDECDKWEVCSCHINIPQSVLNPDLIRTHLAEQTLSFHHYFCHLIFPVCILLYSLHGGGSGKYQKLLLGILLILCITSECAFALRSLFTWNAENPCVSFVLFTTRGQCENKSDRFVGSGPL